MELMDTLDWVQFPKLSRGLPKRFNHERHEKAANF